MTVDGFGPGHDGRPVCGGEKRGGGTCTQAAGWGTPHPGVGRCKLHGGSTPSHVAAAQKVEAERAVATFGLPRDIDPHEALLEELHRTAGAVAWLGAVVAELETGDVVWGKVREKVGGDDRGTTHEAGVNTWVRLWQAERAHLVAVSAQCIKAGIDERRMQLAEGAGEQLAGVLRAVFGRLDLSEGQWALVAVVVPEELRKLATLGTGPPPALPPAADPTSSQEGITTR
jgi:hypothetical protein